MVKKLGLIVNPIAGMGGRVGLKGTDGIKAVQKARQMGAVPESPDRAVRALETLSTHVDDIQIVTPSSPMGRDEAIEAGFAPEILLQIDSDKTTAEDTKRSAELMLKKEVDLLLFAGGDGTARNIYEAVNTSLPVIGIPTGVKMHSGVFSTQPETGGRLAALYMNGDIDQLREVEVMDIDEEAFRRGRVSAQLYGYLQVPYEDNLIQGMKSGSTADHSNALEAIAAHVIDLMESDRYYIIGPGTTTRTIMQQLEIDYTLLGVDVICNRKLVAQDVSENDLVEITRDNPASIVVTPIGGQGYIFGRGNQQISADVIQNVGKDNIHVIAARSKINALERSPLLVDTGDTETDDNLKGYLKVVVGYKRELVHPVE